MKKKKTKRKDGVIVKAIHNLQINLFGRIESLELQIENLKSQKLRDTTELKNLNTNIAYLIFQVDKLKPKTRKVRRNESIYFQR